MIKHVPHPALYLLAALLLSACTTNIAAAQTTPANPDAQIVTTPATQSDDDTLQAAHDPKATAKQKEQACWTTLTNALHDAKHTGNQVQALAALGTLGTNPRAAQLISRSMSDPDLDVRTAAILAAGQTMNRNLTTGIRNLLDDKEPQVAFAAATTLWKMNDHSGEDILIAVVDGDRSANPTLVNGARHDASRTLHSPSALARIGALQGASLLLGPFGFGITAYEYMKKNGGDSSRVDAVELLAQEKTGPVRAKLVAALGDKDPAVRAAAAKSLGKYHERSLGDDIYKLIDDPKLPVRLTAAAAYINSNSPAPPTRSRIRR
jgi:HEAT repeat protein